MATVQGHLEWKPKKVIMQRYLHKSTTAKKAWKNNGYCELSHSICVRRELGFEFNYIWLVLCWLVIFLNRFVIPTIYVVCLLYFN